MQLPPQCPTDFLNRTFKSFNYGSNADGQKITILCTEPVAASLTNVPVPETFAIIAVVCLAMYLFYEWLFYASDNQNLLTCCCKLYDYCRRAQKKDKKPNKNRNASKDCRTCIVCFQILPPHFWIPKLYFYLLFTYAWAQYVFTNFDSVYRNVIMGFASTVLTPIAVALGLILNDSLGKHHEAIRLYEVYTGDIVAFAMEILAFVENAGYKDAKKVDKLSSAEDIVRWNLNNLSANNYSLPSSSISSVQEKEKAIELLQVLEDFKKVKTQKYTWVSFWNDHLKSENSKYPKTRLFFNTVLEGKSMSHIGHATKEIANKFHIKNTPSQVLKQLSLLTTAVNNETQPWLNDPKSARDNFLLSMERIFQTLYVLPQITKLEFRDTQNGNFTVEKLETMDVNYCKQLKTPEAATSKRVRFDASKINEPYTKITDVQEKLNDWEQNHKNCLSCKDRDSTNLTHTQLFLLTLLDYVNELHRTVGGETQTRRTLSTAWRRLYGTYGDISSVNTYRLPQIISVTMEFTLLLSSIILPFSLIDSSVEQLTAIWICMGIQFLFVGLFFGVERVGNPFVATEDAIGFANVSKSAKTTQESIRQLWFIRGVIQQVNPMPLNFNCATDIENGKSDVDDKKTPLVQSSSSVALGAAKNNVGFSSSRIRRVPLLPASSDNIPLIPTGPTGPTKMMSYNGIRF